jgi:hypothetical protein
VNCDIGGGGGSLTKLLKVVCPSPKAILTKREQMGTQQAVRATKKQLQDIAGRL